VHRRQVIALLVACLAGGSATLAVADEDRAPTALMAQTSTEPEDVGTDFGDEPQEEATPAQGLPVTGWRGRDAVVLGLLLLGTGLVLRSASRRPVS
jgi:hypothetical protein